MTARTLMLRAMAAIVAGLACQVVHGELPSPILAMATGQLVTDDPYPNEGGLPERQALETVNPSLSLLPESQLTFPPELVLGEGGNENRRGITSNYNTLILGTDRNFIAREQFVASPPSMFDTVGDYFDGENIEWALGTQESVFILPTPLRGTNKLIPFIDLLQDADELDAHLRMGAGAGLKYLITKDISIDTEVMALDNAGAGDHNPANSSETRFMMIFTVRF